MRAAKIGPDLRLNSAKLGCKVTVTRPNCLPNRRYFLALFLDLPDFCLELRIIVQKVLFQAFVS